jgi:hypothetical protein
MKISKTDIALLLSALSVAQAFGLGLIAVGLLATFLLGVLAR